MSSCDPEQNNVVPEGSLSIGTATDVRMSDCIQNEVSEGNGISNNSFEEGQSDVSCSESGKYARFDKFPSYHEIRRHDVWTKVKQALQNHANEYRISLIILLLILIMGFSILVQQNKNIWMMQQRMNITGSSNNIGLYETSNS